MKLAAVYAIAGLAKEPVPDVVNAAYKLKRTTFGRDYLLPKALDPRLLTRVSCAVAKAAIDSGVSRRTITDWEGYANHLREMMGYDNKILNYFVSTIGWSMFGKKDWQQSEMLKTTAIVDYLTEDFPPAFVTDGNTGSFEEHGKELAAALDELGITNHTLFFNKDEKEVGHVYEAALKTEEAMKCFNETMDFLRELEVM